MRVLVTVTKATWELRTTLVVDPGLPGGATLGVARNTSTSRVPERLCLPALLRRAALEIRGVERGGEGRGGNIAHRYVVVVVVGILIVGYNKPHIHE